MKWASWYLKRKSHYCITFNGCSNYVYDYVNSNFASDLDKKRSTSGYGFIIVGGSISCMSKLQEIVVLSATDKIDQSHMHAKRQLG